MGTGYVIPDLTFRNYVACPYISKSTQRIYDFDLRKLQKVGIGCVNLSNALECRVPASERLSGYQKISFRTGT